MALLRSGVIALFSAMVVAGGFATSANAMRVSPLFLDMTSRGTKSQGTVRVENTRNNPIAIEVKAKTPERSDGSASSKFAVFPPQAFIKPGDVQVFRVKWVGSPQINASRHFLLSFVQVPVKGSEQDTSGFALMTNLNATVHVSPPGSRAALTAENARAESVNGDPAVAFKVTNAGKRYAYLVRRGLEVVWLDAGGNVIRSQEYGVAELRKRLDDTLVRPDETRQFLLPVENPVKGGRIRVRVDDPRS